MGAGNSAVVVDLPRWGPMLSPRVPNLVPIPGPRMERETPGQRPRPNYGHPQGRPLPQRARSRRAAPWGQQYKRDRTGPARRTPIPQPHQGRRTRPRHRRRRPEASAPTAALPSAFPPASAHGGVLRAWCPSESRVRPRSGGVDVASDASPLSRFRAGKRRRSRAGRSTVSSPITTVVGSLWRWAAAGTAPTIPQQCRGTTTAASSPRISHAMASTSSSSR